MAEALLADLPTPGSDGEPDGRPTTGPDRAPVPAAYGDSAYGTGQVLAHLEERGITVMTKVPPLTAPQGRFAKDQFAIDRVARTVTCPATHCDDQPTPPRGRAGPFRPRRRRLPAGIAVHHQPFRAHDQHPRARGPRSPEPATDSKARPPNRDP
jgi:hypothetical protein